MLEDPSEIDDIDEELTRTPIDQQSEGSLRLYLDQLSLAEHALKLILDDQGDREGRIEEKSGRSRNLRDRIGKEIERRMRARGPAEAPSPNAHSTDDAARDVYIRSGGNFADGQSQ